MAIKTNERAIILEGYTDSRRDIILQGTSHLYNQVMFILRGGGSAGQDRDFILSGKNNFGRDFILNTKPDMERSFILNATDPSERLIRYNFVEEEISDFLLSDLGLINEITLNYTLDFNEGNYKSSITKHAPLSKLLYGKAATSKDLNMIQGTRQAEKIADAILRTSAIPPIKSSFKHDIRSIFLEVGDAVTITHLAGLGGNGYQSAEALISSIRRQGVQISYEAILAATKFYVSELLMLTQTIAAGQAGITITYEKGVATITIFADIQGNPPVEGAEVTISTVKKIADLKGQVRFNLLPGRYTAYIKASGYEDAEINFSV